MWFGVFYAYSRGYCTPTSKGTQDYHSTLANNPLTFCFFMAFRLPVMGMKSVGTSHLYASGAALHLQ
jgi:hypothetical protein